MGGASLYTSEVRPSKVADKVCQNQQYQMSPKPKILFHDFQTIVFFTFVDDFHSGSPMASS